MIAWVEAIRWNLTSRSRSNWTRPALRAKEERIRFASGYLDLLMDVRRSLATAR